MPPPEAKGVGDQVMPNNSSKNKLTGTKATGLARIASHSDRPTVSNARTTKTADEIANPLVLSGIVNAQNTAANLRAARSRSAISVRDIIQTNKLAQIGRPLPYTSLYQIAGTVQSACDQLAV